MKSIKRVVAIVLAAALGLSCVWLSSYAVKTTGDVTKSMDYYKEKVYPQDYYWDGGDINTSFPAPVCSASAGSCTCNQFYGASQCHGFALYLAYRVIGSAPKRTLASYVNGASSNGWTCYTLTGLGLQGLLAVGLQPGDIVRAAHDSSYSSGHTAMVWKIEDGKIWFAESWGSRHCKINWTGFNYYSYSLSDICSRYGYVAIWRNGSIVYGTAACAHNYVEGCDKTHPHNVYMLCTKCGDMYYTGATATVEECVCCRGVHDWDYSFDAAHPHREKRTCKICGKLEYTGETVWQEDCPECAFLPYDLAVAVSADTLSPGGKVTITASAKNYTSMTVCVIRDGMIVDELDIGSDPIDYVATGTGVYSLRLRAFKDGAETSRELARAFTVSLHVDAVTVGNGTLNIRYADALDRAAAEQAAMDRGGSLTGYGDDAFTVSVGVGSLHAATDGRACYQLIPGAFSWTEARDIASAVGGRLADVGDAIENECVAALVRTSDVGSAWIGATDENSEGRWTWTDGTPAGFTDWSVAHSTEYDVYKNWALVFRGGGWCEAALDGPSGGFVVERELSFTYTAGEDGVTVTGTNAATDVAFPFTIPDVIEGVPVVGLSSAALDGINVSALTLPSGLCDFDPASLGGFGAIYAPAGTAAARALIAAGVDWEAIMNFTDVADGKWYVDYVRDCYKYGYLSGTSAATFEPDSPMTRGMTVTVLGNMSGADKSLYAGSSFEDIPIGKWYSAYVEWAYQSGIAAGYGGRFMQANPLTREQLAVFMRAYAAYLGRDVAVADAEAALAPFADAGAISPWAREAVAWAVENGLLSGTGGGMISPGATATRAQICVIIMRFIEGA